MKHLTIPSLLLLLALFSACRNNPVVNEMTGNGDSVRIHDSIDLWRDQAKAEMDEYRVRIRNRIDEMQRDLDDLRARRKAGLSKKQQQEYDQELEQREANQRSLQEKFDRMGDNMESEWKEFKRDVDDFFNRNRNKYNNYGDSIHQLKEQK